MIMQIVCFRFKKGTSEVNIKAHMYHFAREEDIDVYFDHPAHTDFIAKHKDIWEPGVLVLNVKVE